VRGAGEIISLGSVNVSTDGYAYSKATGRTRSFSVAALSIAVNVANAELTVEQSAYLDLSGSLNITSGSLNVRSEIYRTGDFGMAQSSVGGSGAGVSIALSA
jgi:hypothetical protein